MGEGRKLDRREKPMRLVGKKKVRERPGIRRADGSRRNQVKEDKRTKAWHDEHLLEKKRKGTLCQGRIRR